MSGAQIAAEVRAGIEEAAIATGAGILTATITRVSGADESTYPPTPGTPTAYTTSAIISDYSAMDRNGTQVTARDVKVMLAVPLVDALGNETVPSNGDTLSLSDGRVLHIVNVMPVQPGGVVLYWQCRARGSDQAGIVDPGPDPDPEPAPFVVGIMGQSQPNYLLDAGSFYRQIASGAPGDGNLIVYESDKGQAITKTTVSAATVAGVNPTLAAWSYLFSTVLPDREIVIVDLCEGGSGRNQLMSDADTGRNWSEFQAMVERVRQDYDDIDLIVECWMGNDVATAKTMGPEWAPFYIGQRWGGESFTLGTPNPDSTANAATTVDHCLWDIEAPEDAYGRGLFARGRTKWSVVGWPTFNAAVAGEPEMDNFSDRAGYPTQVDRPARNSLAEMFSDSRFQTFSRYNGFSSHIARMTDGTSSPAIAGTHPSVLEADGQILMGWPYAQSIMQGAGVSIQEPVISAIEGPADGSYVDIVVDLPNGGSLTTLRAFRGGSVASPVPHQQSVVGFEISRSGGDRRPVFLSSETSYPSAHRGTVTITDTGSGSPRKGRVRITPSDVFGVGDQIEYLRGDAGAILLENRDTAARLYLDMLIEHVPSWYDSGATYGMEGVPVRPQPDALNVPVEAVVTPGNITVLEGAPISAAGTGTSAATTFMAAAGSNRMVILAAHTFEVGTDPVLSADMGGQAFALIGSQLHGGTTTYEQTAFFAIKEADIPTGSQTVTLSSATPANAIGFQLFTIGGADQVATPAFSAAPSAGARSHNIIPSADNSLVVAIAWESTGNRTYAFTGATAYGPSLTINNTTSMALATITDAPTTEQVVSFVESPTSPRAGISLISVAPASV